MFGMALKTKEKPQRLSQEPSAPAKPLSGNALFEALICDLHWTALQIGGCACIMNSCVARGCGVIPNSCRNQFPVDSTIISAALINTNELAADIAVVARIKQMVRDLSDARKATEPYVGTDMKVGSPIPTYRAITQLAAVWRRLCEETLGIVNDLEPDARWRLNGVYTENVLTLNRFLKAAAAGKHDSVDAHGEIALPILPQRRRHARFALLQNCKVTARGVTYPAFAEDISIQGMGISCKGALRLKELVSIELQMGRRFQGTVVWGKGGDYGVQFSAALAKTDPLIFG